MRAYSEGAGGDHDRVAFAGILAVVEARRQVLAAINDKQRRRFLELVVDAEAVLFCFAIQ
jgi:hypothetical protein